LIAHFRLVGRSEGGTCYEERTEEGHPPVIGTICIQDWALPQPTPASLDISLHFFSEDRPPHPTVQETPGRQRLSRDVLKPGTSVTVIKNIAGPMHESPEWLGQYLGRTGTVLWTRAE
jgi:hypothetical protein